ncbi:hypothetical protein OAS95_04610 [Pelagibacteraceae bacterium]|nr:hypothetical protein [Pelagibacteraceae bacterium]
MSFIKDITQDNIKENVYILNDKTILDSITTTQPLDINCSYRLNIDTTYSNPLEQYVDEIVKFHSSRLNVPLNNQQCVDFSIISPRLNKLGIIYDNVNHDKFNKAKSPLFSIITNLSDYTHPLLLTEINNEQYKYKQFTDQTHNQLFLLKKYMHLVFDSSKFHGFLDYIDDTNVEEEQPYLLINLWSYQLDYIPYYLSVNSPIKCGLNLDFIDINEDINKQIVNTSILDYNFFERLLYGSMLILDEEFLTNIKMAITGSIHTIILHIKKNNKNDKKNNINDKQNNINTWRISNHNYDNELIQNLDRYCTKKLLLLDLTKSSYTLIEKYIYDIAMFHFARLNIHDVETHYVEFWYKSKFQTHDLHVDVDESLRLEGKHVYPLLSCVTYLNDVSGCPTILTNIDMDCYKYKDFDSQTELILSLPQHNKQITFDSCFYHGSTTLYENEDIHKRYIIAINLWKTKPYNIEYYNPSLDNSAIDDTIFGRNESMITLQHDNNDNCLVRVDKETINYNLFNDILYNKKTDACYRFNELIKPFCVNNNNTPSIFKFILDNSITEQNKKTELTNKYGVIMDDIYEILNDNTNFKHNRFLQRFSFAKIYSTELCKYIINACECYAKHTGGWMTNIPNHYPTTYLHVEKIPMIFGIVAETLNPVINKIKMSYSLPEDMVINIVELFILKDSYDTQKQVETHHDMSLISFNILLTDTVNFEGGNTYFDDGITCRLEQGDILIHSSRIKHSDLPITSGCRYSLVGFVNVIE